MIHNPTRNTTDSIRCTGVAIRPLATLMATDGGTAWTICGHFVCGSGNSAASIVLQVHDGTNRIITISVNGATNVLSANVRNAAGTAANKSVTLGENGGIAGKVICFAFVWVGDAASFHVYAATPDVSGSDLTGSVAAPFGTVAGVSLYDPVDTSVNGNGAEGHLQVQVLDIALTAEQFASAVAENNAGAWLRNHRANVVWACGHALGSLTGCMPGVLPSDANTIVVHDADGDGLVTDEDWDEVPASGVAVAGTGLRFSRPSEASAAFALRTQAQIGTGAHTVPTDPIVGRNPCLARIAAGRPAGVERIAIVSNSRGNLQQEDTEDPPTGGAGWQVNYAAGLAKKFVTDFNVGVGNYRPLLSGANGFLLDFTSATSSGATAHDGAADTPWDDWCRFGYNSGAGTSSTDATGPGAFVRVMNASDASNMRVPVDFMGLVEATDPLTIRVALLKHPSAPLGAVAIQTYDGSTFTTQESLSLNTAVGSTTVAAYTGGATSITITGDHRSAILVGDLLTIEVSAGAFAPAMVTAINQTLSGGNTVLTTERAINHKSTSTGRTIPTAGNAVAYGPWGWVWGTATFAGPESTKQLRVLMPGGDDTTAFALVYASEAWATNRTGIVPMPMGWGGHGYFLHWGTWGGFSTVSARSGQSPISAFLRLLQIDAMIVTAAEQGSSASNTQLFIDQFARAYPDWRRRLILASGPAMPSTSGVQQMEFDDGTAEWAAWQAANAPTLGVPWLSAYASLGDAVDYHGGGYAHNNAHISAEGNRLVAEAWFAQASTACRTGGGGRSRARSRTAIAAR